MYICILVTFTSLGTFQEHGRIGSKERRSRRQGQKVEETNAREEGWDLKASGQNVGFLIEPGGRSLHFSHSCIIKDFTTEHWNISLVRFIKATLGHPVGQWMSAVGSNIPGWLSQVLRPCLSQSATSEKAQFSPAKASPARDWSEPSLALQACSRAVTICTLNCY